MKLLIVEDDKAILKLMQEALTNAGYLVDTTENGLVAADKIEANDYALIILDVMLPIYDGYDLMPLIQDTGVPVLMVSALASIDDKIKGFNVGVEDYLTKPFELAELLARVKIILRRHHPEVSQLSYKHLSIDLKAQHVSIEGEEVSLTPKEFTLICFFIENEGLALSRDYLLERIWEHDLIESRTLDLHVQRLRKKLHLDKGIRTIYRFGYILDKAL